MHTVAYAKSLPAYFRTASEIHELQNHLENSPFRPAASFAPLHTQEPSSARIEAPIQASANNVAGIPLRDGLMSRSNVSDRVNHSLIPFSLRYSFIRTFFFAFHRGNLEAFPRL